MTQRVSRSQFKARALEYFRHIQASGKSMIVTDHGQPRFEIRPVAMPYDQALDGLSAPAAAFSDSALPFLDDDWEAAQ